MLLYLSKILEISGFILATIFGGIFLNRDLFKKVAYKFDKKVTDISLIFSLWLDKWFLPLARYAALISEHEITKQILGGIIMRGLAVIISIIGSALEITWLFWLGIALISVYGLLTAFGGLLRVIHLSKKYKSWKYMWSYPLILCWGLLLGFMIVPILIILYLIVLYSLMPITLLATFLVTSDNLKKGLIITGAFLIIIGLILEIIVIW